MRVTVIGNSGAGKSTLAGRLAERFDLVPLDLDTVAWVPGKVAVPRAHGVAVAELEGFCASGPRWVVEGCYAGLAGVTLGFAPLLVFLEPGAGACLENCRRRPWEPHKYTSKAEQDARLEFLLAWVGDYYTRDDDRSLAAHQSLFERYTGPKLKVETPASDDLLEKVARLAGDVGRGSI